MRTQTATPAGGRRDPRRYLFLDDREIVETHGLTRTVHAATKHPGNPIFEAGPAWEGAMVPSTVLFDDDAGLFKMWYTTHALVPGVESTFVSGFATSEDGIHWERPVVGAYEYEGSRQNNLCMVNTRNGMGVIKDTREPDPARRFKTLFYRGGRRAKSDIEQGWGEYETWGFHLAFSPDGARWTLACDGPVLTETGDTQSLFGWDEAYARYVSYVRPKRAERDVQGADLRRKRVIGRSESKDCLSWSSPVDVLVPDTDDPRGAELYFMPVHRYYGHYVGFVHVFVPSPEPSGPFWPEVAHSGDGIRWRRLNHGGRQRLVHPGPEGSFDSGMIRCARGIIEQGDELWLYYGGWRGDHAVSRQHGYMTTPREAQRKAGAIGLATLRLDGFVSLDAGEQTGSMTTTPILCAGTELVVNARVEPGGALRAELLDEHGGTIRGFEAVSCEVFCGDATRHTVTWESGSRLDRLRDARIRLRLHATHTQLYSYTL